MEFLIPVELNRLILKQRFPISKVEGWHVFVPREFADEAEFFVYENKMGVTVSKKWT